MARRVLTKIDIDQLLEEGASEVRLGPSDIVTALAREYALERGLRLVPAQAESPQPAAEPAQDALATEIRTAVISALGEEPAGLDEIISRAFR